VAPSAIELTARRPRRDDAEGAPYGDGPGPVAPIASRSQVEPRIVEVRLRAERRFELGDRLVVMALLA
jgi:hypothetical protein